MIDNPTGTAIIWPMIAHMLLTYAVFFLMSARRIRAVRDGRQDPRKYKLNIYGDEPEEAVLARANIANQFEVPVLFHIACLALYVTGAATILALTLAWLFVISRIAHSVVHLTSNVVLLRRRVFIGGIVANGLLWLLLTLHLIGLTV